MSDIPWPSFASLDTPEDFLDDPTAPAADADLLVDEPLVAEDHHAYFM